MSEKLPIKVPPKWFLFCEDSASNEAVAVATTGLRGFNSDFSQRLCGDGKMRHLYEVPNCAFARRFAKPQFKTQVFFSLDDGKPQLWALPIRRKVNLAKIVEASNKIKNKASDILVHRIR